MEPGFHVYDPINHHNNFQPLQVSDWLITIVDRGTPHYLEHELKRHCKELGANAFYGDVNYDYLIYGYHRLTCRPCIVGNWSHSGFSVEELNLLNANCEIKHKEILKGIEENKKKLRCNWALICLFLVVVTFFIHIIFCYGRDLPFMAINRDKEIVPTTANTEDINPKKYLVLEKSEFVYSGMQTGRDICIRIALSKFGSPVLLSPAYTTFKIKEEKGLLSEYLFLNFKSNEMDRLGWFKSDSSVRANLDWEGFCEIKIRCLRSRCRGR